MGIHTGGQGPSTIPQRRMPAGGQTNPQGGQQGGGSVWDWLGPALYGAGTLYSAYSANHNATVNQKAQEAWRTALGDKVGSMAWGGELPTIEGLTGIARGNNGTSIGSIVGQDGISQLLRANPANKTLEMMMNGGTLPALAAADNANTTQQVSQLRGGFGSLGARFGTAAAGAEGRLRQGISRDINVRNAGVMANAAQLLSGNYNNALQIGAGLTQSDTQNRLAAYNMIYSQLLGQRQYNANLLGIQAGLPPAPITAPGYGGAISDIGQLWTLLPYLRGA